VIAGYHVAWDDTTAAALARLAEAEIVYLLLDVTEDLKRDPNSPGVLWHTDPPLSWYTLDIGTHIRIGFWVDDEKHTVTVKDVVTGTFDR
jgi:mRNA-degrading endonuclease RelE of RelBE toxin-antitoxin system